MKAPKLYHSALQDELPDLKELEFYYKDGNTVIHHDLTKGTLPIFNKADVFYLEPSWRRGHDLFAKRAGKKDADYTEFLLSIQHLAETTKRPFFMIGGKHMMNIIKPHHQTKISLHQYESILCIWNHKSVTFKTNFDAIDYLSTKFDCVADLCCGYGNTLKNFKNFVGSDINKKCIYYVAKNLMDYNG